MEAGQYYVRLVFQQLLSSSRSVKSACVPKPMKHFVRKSKRVIKSVLGRDILQGSQLNLPTERHGSEYGGWVVYPHALSPESVVYSFGLGDDVSFDLSLIERYALTVHAFDPTPQSIEWVKEQSLPEAFVFHSLGIGDFDGMATFSAPENPAFVSYSMADETRSAAGQVQAPVCRLSTIMHELGHDHVDLLKMDIEGAEYDVLQDIARDALDVRQVLVEFHHRFQGIEVDRTKCAIRLLNGRGYRIFSVSPSGEEYSFIRQ